MIKSNIKKYRRDKGWSQYKLGKESGFSQSEISMWETGARAIDTDQIDTIAKALGVQSHLLLIESGSNSTQSSLATVPLIGFINPGGVVELLEKEGDSAQKVNCPTSMNPMDTLAFESKDSHFYNGFIVFADKPIPGVPVEFLGCICIAEVNGKKMLKRIERGSRPGFFDLYHPASDGEPMKDCLVTSTSFIKHMEQRPKIV